MRSETWREELKVEIHKELNEGPLAHRTHYSKATYADGCRGPMCTKAERDETKARQERKFRKTGLPYRPQYDTPENCERDDFLNQVIWRHRRNRDKPKFPRSPVYPPGWVHEPVPNAG